MTKKKMSVKLKKAIIGDYEISKIRKEIKVYKSTYKDITYDIKDLKKQMLNIQDLMRYAEDDRDTKDFYSFLEYPLTPILYIFADNMSVLFPKKQILFDEIDEVAYELVKLQEKKYEEIGLLKKTLGLKH